MKTSIPCAGVRRVTALKAACSHRLALLVGVDDVIVEGVRTGAVGWIAGLVNAFPRESVALFNFAARGEDKKRARCIAGSGRCCGWTP
jgi:4-hydroxy-tetrahydrodipicolinate synthase